MPEEKGQAWVVSVNMGYGHQRAAYPLKDMAYERIITANSDKMISYDEKKIWEKSRAFYEFISRMKSIPVLGSFAFGLFNKTLEISPFFPFRDLSRPNFEVLLLKDQILKKGLCKSLIEYVKKKDLPFITTHPIPAMAAFYLGLKNIYCVATDTDIARAWVIDEPKKNTITYFAPCMNVAVRLREYGVQEDRIILTGFPLPKENIGGENSNILKKDFLNRLLNLDPNRVFIQEYRDIIMKKFGSLPKSSSHPLTITYAVGGAGALPQVGVEILKALSEKLVKKEIIVNLVAGTRLDILSYYSKEIDLLGLKELLGSSINIVFALDKKVYFADFNEALRKTDVLWTKPSELSFYAALGLPIIIAPPIGAQEKCNMEWLRQMGSGFIQENPDYCYDWLFYWLQDGRLAKAAWQGLIDAPLLGTYKIEKTVRGLNLKE